MNKKYTNPLEHPLTVGEVVELADIKDAPFKNFCLKWLDNPLIKLGRNHSDEELLAALQQATTVTGLTNQIMLLLKKLDEPVYANHNGVSLVVGPKGGEDGPVYNYAKNVHRFVRVLGAVAWKDRELEFFEYLLGCSNLPADDWHRFFDSFYSVELDYFAKDVPADLKHHMPANRLIAKGLLRHIGEDHAESSSFSIKFWANEVLWSNQEDEQAQVEQRTESEKVFSHLAHTWYFGLVLRNEPEKAEQFVNWLHQTHKWQALADSHQGDIWNAEWIRPVSSPMDLADNASLDEEVLVKSEALFHKYWLTVAGDLQEATDVEYEALYADLSDIAKQCAEDKVKLSSHSVSLLIRGDKWAPIGHVRPNQSSHITALSKKHLALMRSVLRYEIESFDPYDYWATLSSLVHVGAEPQAALKQLLITLRQCSVASSDNTLEFKPKMPNRTHSAHLLISEPFKGLTPFETVSAFIHMLIDRPFPTENHKTAMSMADYCLSRIVSKKGCRHIATPDNPYYTDHNCVEENRSWRRAYVQALGELGYDLGGKVHKALQFCQRNDPSEDIRGEATHALKMIKRGLNKDLDDRKSLIAAFFWFRWAQREALGLDINEGAAMLVRRGEMRLDYKHRAEFLYNQFI